jgi:lipopolysaccharide export system protein LptA
MNFVRIYRSAVPLVLVVHSLTAQLDQATAIRDFAIPRFDEKGSRLSMLQGKELRRQGADEATINEMDLRTYDADHPEALEIRLRSSSARYFFKSSRANSPRPIRIDGPDYEINGRVWSWDGKKRRVLIDHDVRVRFDATLTDFLESDCDPIQADAANPPGVPLRPLPEETGQTLIHSEKLELLTIERDHKFVFTGDVRIVGRNLQVTCDRLEVLSVRAPDEKSNLGPFGSISSIYALGRVRIEQRQRSAVAGKATIDVTAGTIVLEDNPVVFEDKGKVEGHKIVLYRGQRRVVVEAGEARAKVTLPPIRDLGVLGNQVNEDGKTVDNPDAKPEPRPKKR